MKENIYEKIAREGEALLSGMKIKDIAFGSNYAAVETDGGCGAAYISSEAYAEASEKGFKKYLEAEAGSFAGNYVKGSPFQSCLALAVINSVLGTRGEPDDKELYNSIISAENVAMVGYFSPLMDEVKAKGGVLNIFELKDIPGTLKPEKAREIFPECAGIIITGAVLANKTAEQYLPFIPEEAKTMFMGPSVPFSDELRKYANLSGAEITDKNAAFEAVSAGKCLRGSIVKYKFLPKYESRRHMA